MTRVAPVVPAQSDLLCEFCGYTLNGLPEASNCPECGHPITASLHSTRKPPRWESATAGKVLRAFLATSGEVIVRPTRFYRTTTSRGDVDEARKFGLVHWWIASILFGLAGAMHAGLFYRGVGPPVVTYLTTGVVGAVALSCTAYVALVATTWAANKLTAWEAAYRGIRLPIDVVRRSMYYHAAHYFPVGLLAVVTVAGYRLLLARDVFAASSVLPYLYVLCAEVVLAAGYLFHTYWIGMRNMMYANR